MVLRKYTIIFLLYGLLDPHCNISGTNPCIVSHSQNLCPFLHFCFLFYFILFFILQKCSLIDFPKQPFSFFFCYKIFFLLLIM